LSLWCPGQLLAGLFQWTLDYPVGLQSGEYPKSKFNPLHYNQEMGFSFEIDEEHRVGRWSLDGPVTDDSFRDSLNIVSGILIGLNLRGGIVDFTEVTFFDVSVDMLKRLANTNPVLPGDMLRLIVAPDNKAFGMSRTFLALSELSRPNLFVVRDLEKAYHILGIKTPNFKRLASSD
jgi:hypothetical protein